MKAKIIQKITELQKEIRTLYPDTRISVQFEGSDRLAQSLETPVRSPITEGNINDMSVTYEQRYDGIIHADADNNILIKCRSDQHKEITKKII